MRAWKWLALPTLPGLGAGLLMSLYPAVVLGVGLQAPLLYKFPVGRSLPFGLLHFLDKSEMDAVRVPKNGLPFEYTIADEWKAREESRPHRSVWHVAVISGDHRVLSHACDDGAGATAADWEVEDRRRAHLGDYPSNRDACAFGGGLTKVLYENGDPEVAFRPPELGVRASQVGLNLSLPDAPRLPSLTVSRPLVYAIPKTGFIDSAAQEYDGPYANGGADRRKPSHDPLWVRVSPAVIGLSLYGVGTAVAFIFIGLALGLFEDSKRRHKDRAKHDDCERKQRSSVVSVASGHSQPIDPIRRSSGVTRDD